jgi:hypothetical protein
VASRIAHFLRGLNRDTIVIAGSFAPNGSGTVASSSNKGKGWSVARTSTGLFTITLADKFYELVSFTATLQLASADDKLAQCGTVDLSAKTAQIRIWDKSAAAVADVSANANNRVNFALELRNTTRI